MKTILCPVDFSANSESAVRYAMELSKTIEAKIILLYAFETPVLYSDPAFLPVSFDTKFMHDEAQKKLNAFHKKVVGAKGGKNVEMILQQGLASSRICEIALEKKAELIVMGITGTHAGERFLMGSNASRVIRNAPCMVLLVPHKARFDGLDKIAYATDLSEDNLSHAMEIIPLAKKFKSEILFLYIDKGAIARDETGLKKVTEKIKKHISYPKKSGYVCTDDSVAGGIDYFMKHQKASCLAVFTRHRSLIQELYKPSISKKVSLHSSIPLLIIHEHDFRSDDLPD